jgi:hypothetical protein
MTEAEWLSCSDVGFLLGQPYARGRPLARKLRLFACACCRHIWPLLRDERSRHAVEVVERFADGLATEEERASAEVRARAVVSSASEEAWQHATHAVQLTSMLQERDDDPHQIIAAVFACTECGNADAGAERAAHCRLLRDLFHDPYRIPVFDPAWSTPPVLDLARRCYEERDFRRLPELADLLASAGCADEDILTHCREPGEHARGCWVLDLLLGQE